MSSDTQTRDYQNLIQSPYYNTYMELTNPGSDKILIVNDKQIYFTGVNNTSKRYTLAGMDVSTTGNAIKDASLAVTTGLSNTIDAVTSTSNNIGTTIASYIKDFDKSGTGSSVSNAISSFGGSLFQNSGNATSGTNFDIGASLGLNGGLGNATGTVISDAAKSVGAATASMSKSVKEFVAPVTEVANAISNIGKEFDAIIKDTFLGQVFGIKGAEILCTLFCIIISLLSCSDRQALYDLVVQIRQGIKNANAVINNINDMTKTPVEVPLFNDKTIADNIKSLFGEKVQGKQLDSFLGLSNTKGTETKNITPSTFEIPPNVLSTIQIIVKVLSVLAKGQITVPVGLSGSGGIWDFAKTVLSIVQSVAVQMIDEFLTKYIKKLEKLLKDMMPQICVGNLASSFINKIIKAITSIKDFLMQQLKGLLGSMSGFGLKWKKFGWYFREIQELLAMLEALNLILKNFPDLALACGVSPCPNNPDQTTQEIKDAINNGTLIDETNIPAPLYPMDQLPKYDLATPELDRLTNTFKDLMNSPNICSYSNNDGFCIVMPDMFKDAPAMIKDIALSPEYRAALGSAYSMYADENITVVYTFKLQGGN